METQTLKTERLHSLDSLRAIMMLLGLVLHAAITYGTLDYGNAWILKDPNTTHLFNDFIVVFIHEFRMQLFFVVAGFFGAMLFYKKSPYQMLKNRLHRVFIPFVVFVLLLWPTVMFTFSYTEFIFNGSSNALNETLSRFSSFKSFIPPLTFHLWFLYYLTLISLVVVVIALILKKLPTLTTRTTLVFSWLIQKPLLRVLFLGGLTAIVYHFMGTWSVDTSTSFIPDLNTFTYYGIFYVVGWILFKSKHHLDSLMKFDWFCTLLGIALFTLYFFMYNAFIYETHILLKSIMVWLLIFGITGLFIRYTSNYSSTMRYISDASYWVYLIHLSIAAIIPGLIANWPIHGTLKFLFVMFSNGIICFVSYHYLVRETFIGQFLNGRKYSRKISDIKKAEELARLNNKSVATTS